MLRKLTPPKPELGGGGQTPLTHRLTHSLSDSLTHSLSRTHPVTLTHSLSLTHFNSLAYSLTQSLTHSLTHTERTSEAQRNALRVVHSQHSVRVAVLAIAVSQEFAPHSLSCRRHDVSGDDCLDASASGYGDDFGSA